MKPIEKPMKSVRIALAVLTMAASSTGFAADTAGWSDRAPLPTGRAEIGVAEIGGKIYVIGGTEGDGHNPSSWATTSTTVYDPARNEWRQAAPLPHGLSHPGVAVLDGKLYAIGGFMTPVHLQPQNLGFVYDVQENRWTALPKISSQRGSVAVAAVDGKLHIFGGRISNKIVKIPTPPGAPPMSAGFGTVGTHQIYDPHTRRWSKGSPMPGPSRDHLGIAVLDGKIHLFGGRVADVIDNLDRHDVYDPATGKWAIAAPLPRPRSSGAYTVLDGMILYAGGECKPGGQPFTPNVFEDLAGYDAKTDSWKTLASLPKPRHAFGAATVGHVAYFVAGAPLCGGGTSTDVQAFMLA